MTKCQECSEPTKRRTRCEMCLKLVCAWCRHHIHNTHVARTEAGLRIEALRVVAAPRRGKR